MTWLLAALIVILVLDTARMRGRVAALVELAPADTPPAATHRFLVAPGVTIDDATRRAASAHARAHQLDVLDLVPGDLPAFRSMGLAQLIDPAKVRADRLSLGRTAGHALLVTDEIAARAGVTEPADEVAFVRAAVRLKTYAPTSFDIAVAPAEHARRGLGRSKAVLAAILGPSLPVALAIQPIFLGLLALGVVYRPILGGVALALWHLQPLIATIGTNLRPRDRLLASIGRAPLELWTLVSTLASKNPTPPGPDPIAARRPEYAQLWADAAGFFEARRETCPICAGRDLKVHLRVSDLIQHKPGRFTLEKCAGCGHIFQNPRLSLAGLNYYYKDFYDGLGEEGMEFMFGQGVAGYRARARMVREVASPKTWLDVGAGHGHFCVIGKDELPDTRFDGLDLSESIEEAHRRRWIATAYRGLFPEVAPTIAGKYDAISMSHYLEHTRDPRQELEAAHVALAPHGHLMIEVPDPEFGFGRALGRFWLPWFQPQHQHLLSTTNLERLLREHGFTPITWHRGTAHQRVDFAFGMWLLLSRIAPPDAPWRSGGALARIWRASVFTLGAPFLLVSWAADHIAGPIIERRKRSNTYRVLARRD
jgi:SAM-dependent methyltransferase